MMASGGPWHGTLMQSKRATMKTRQLESRPVMEEPRRQE